MLSLNRCSTSGALTEEEELTALGLHLSHLPVDPRIGKMMIMGAIFGCLEPVLIIAAGMAHRSRPDAALLLCPSLAMAAPRCPCLLSMTSNRWHKFPAPCCGVPALSDVLLCPLRLNRDPFVLPLEKKAEADDVKRRFSGGTCSDHISILRAYQVGATVSHGTLFSDNEKTAFCLIPIQLRSCSTGPGSSPLQGWREAVRHGGHAAARDYCWRSFLSANTLQMMQDMVRQVLSPSRMNRRSIDVQCRS